MPTHLTIQDLADFYSLSALPKPEDNAHLFIRDEIINRIRGNLLHELESIILREFRHARNRMEIKDVGGKPKYVENLSKDYLELRRYLKYEFREGNKGKRLIDSHEIKNKLGLKVDFNLIANSFVTNFHDPDNCDYGGNKWKEITKHYIKIKETNPNNFNEFCFVVDRLFDFVHNTDQIVSSFRGGIDGWMLTFLEFKKLTINIFELFLFTSPDFAHILKDHEIREFLRRVRPFMSKRANIGLYSIIEILGELSIPFYRRLNIITGTPFLWSKLNNVNLFLVKFDDLVFICDEYKLFTCYGSKNLKLMFMNEIKETCENY